MNTKNRKTEKKANYMSFSIITNTTVRLNYKRFWSSSFLASLIDLQLLVHLLRLAHSVLTDLLALHMNSVDIHCLDSGGDGNLLGIKS